MTNNQRDNLLKNLLNKPVETPNENLPSYSDTITFNNNLADRYTQHFEYPFYATPYRMLKKDNVSVGFNTQAVTILEYTSPTYMYTQAIWLNDWNIIDMIADDNGYYGITIYQNKVFLVYFEIKKDENGIYQINSKIAYDITSVLVEATGDTNPQNSAYNGSIKIHKSPIDRKVLNCYESTKSNIFCSN